MNKAEQYDVTPDPKANATARLYCDLFGSAESRHALERLANLVRGYGCDSIVASIDGDEAAIIAAFTQGGASVNELADARRSHAAMRAIARGFAESP